MAFSSTLCPVTTPDGSAAAILTLSRRKSFLPAPLSV